MRRYLVAVDTFDQWLVVHRLMVDEIGDAVLVRYVASQGFRTIRTTGHKKLPHTVVGVSHLLAVFITQRVIPPPAQDMPTTQTEHLLANYDHHLTRAHGTAPLTRHRYLYFARQFLASALTKLIKRLVIRAGLPRRSSGAHLFRHTAATHMVRQGVSFKAIADVLGHQSLQTTGIYAKLDLPSLEHVALPWPGGAQ